MKRLLRSYILDVSSLYIVSSLASGLYFARGATTILLAGIGLTLVSLFAKPIVNLLLLPLNLVTFGIFRWVGSAIIFYLVTLIVSDFKVQYFDFGGLTSAWIDIPKFYFEGILAFVAFSLIFSIISSFLHWMAK